MEKLLIISWNCWVKIMNEMETLSTFCVLPLLVSYLELLQSQIMHSSEILHTLTNMYCKILLWSHNTLCHTAYTFQWEVWTEQSRKTLDYQSLLKANFHLKILVNSLIATNTYISFALLRDQTRLTSIVGYTRKTILKLHTVSIFTIFPVIHIRIRLIYSINYLIRKKKTYRFSSTTSKHEHYRHYKGVSFCC